MTEQEDGKEKPQEKTVAGLEREIARLKEAHAEEVMRLLARIRELENPAPTWKPGPRRDDDGLITKYGLPGAPRKHLVVLKDGSMEMYGSEEEAVARINGLGLGNFREVWEMKKRTIVRP